MEKATNIKLILLKVTIVCIIIAAIVFGGTSCTGTRSSAAYCPNMKHDHTAFQHKHYNF
jgi:hypothetical protein